MRPPGPETQPLNRPNPPWTSKPWLLGTTLLGLLGGTLSTPGAEPIASCDWPTLRGHVQRWGFYPSFPKPPFSVKWRKELWRELTGPRAEVIIAKGLCLLGTYAGNLYAWDLQDGQERWRFKTGGPIGHSATVGDNSVFCGSMDRHLYALNLDSGNVKWRFAASKGIWIAPLYWQQSVFFGDRQGWFYCVDARSGQLRWRFQTGDRILTTASVTEAGDHVVFASEDMHVYCLRAADGQLLWKSRKLPGLSLRDYAPVIVGGLALVTSNPVKDFHTIMGEHQNFLLRRTGFKGPDDRYLPGTAHDVEAEQDAIVDFLRAHPEEQTFFAFRTDDGTEPWVAPVLYTGGLHNPMSPPCYNPTTGEIFTFVRSAYGIWDGGGEVRPYTGVGKLNPATGRVALVNHGHPSSEPGRPPGSKDMPWMTFNTIGDETQTLASSPDTLLSIHQGFIGSMNLLTRQTASLYGKRDTYGGFYGPGHFGWEHQSGPARAQAAGQPFGIVNEWHGPARALVSVSGNRVVFPVGAQVICLEGR